MFPRLSAFAFSRASSDRLTYAKSFRSAASRVTASESAAEDPDPEPLVEAEASEARFPEETSESEESFALRASSRSVSLSLAESWPVMMSASDRPELAVPSNGEGDRLGPNRRRPERDLRARQRRRQSARVQRRGPDAPRGAGI